MALSSNSLRFHNPVNYVMQIPDGGRLQIFTLGFRSLPHLPQMVDAVGA